MALFTLPQMIQRLTKGFVKVTGRMPDGLEKIKIKQEALERIKQQDKVVDMEGNVIDTSKGIMGGRQADKFISKNKTMIDEAIDNASPGFAGDIKYDAELVAEDLAERMGKVYDDLPTKERLDLYDQAYTGLSKQRFKGMKKPKDDPEEKAMGGRIGLKTGMSRRAFLKLMGGVGAGIGALKTGLLKLAGKGAASQAAKEIITTPAAAGKPEWFDALVTRVINEGTDVTKQLAYKERLVVNTKQISPTEQVTIYRDLEDGSVRINYSTPFSKNEKGELIKTMNDPEDIDLIVRPGVADEANPRPTATFEAGEADVRVANMDGDMEFDGERIVDNVNDLRQDVTNLKIYARGDNKPTMKEFVEQRKKQKEFDEFQKDPVKQAEYLEETYGPPREPDAKGGLAGMLGE